MRAAAIGIGSNSLRMLVAELYNHSITAILRKREGLRVFASLNAQNEIDGAMIRQACDSVEAMRLAAVEAGAEEIHLFATSAVRDAGNQNELQEALLQATGLPLEIVSGEKEAMLSFVGATEDGYSGMIDIGGGSTEIVIGQRENIQFAQSLQAGAVRLFRQLPIASAQDAYRVKETVQGLFAPYRQTLAQIKTPTVWVGVGGTMTVLAACVQHVDWKDHHSIHGFSAKVSDVQYCMETLANMSLAQRKRLPSLPPDRADIVVHGFAILLGCMEELHIPGITVSEHTNLDGYLKLMQADE